MSDQPPRWSIILPSPWRLIKQNLFWAFGYNTLAIPIGMGILYPFVAQVVSPELAALLMATSSLSVTLNTLRMRGFVPGIRRKFRMDSPEFQVTPVKASV